MIHVYLIMQLFIAVIPSQQPNFEAQVVDSNVAIGYGLAIGDVDGDRKPDILLADKKQFVWYRNGDWKRFVMIANLTSSDNVCIAARDIDGDGMVEVAVGAQWNPGETSDTTKSGSVHYLIRPKDPTQLWSPVKLHHEPTVHRMRWVKVQNHGAGKEMYHLVVLPLHGRGNKNGEGEAVRVFAYEMPDNPRGKWKYILIDQSMHMTHNLDVGAITSMDQEVVWLCGKEGVKFFMPAHSKWPEGNFLVKDRSFGEVRAGAGLLVGISPMHGNELAIHDQVTKTILTTDLNQGHALAVDDMVQQASSRDEIVVGWREPNKENKVGIKIFVSDIDSTYPKWQEFWIDDNGLACEDLQVADLNGDGKKDIIAAGRASHNLKIYWNKSQ